MPVMPVLLKTCAQWDRGGRKPSVGGFRHNTRLKSHKARPRIPQGAWHCDWHSSGAWAFDHWLRAVGIRIQVLPASYSCRGSSSPGPLLKRDHRTERDLRRLGSYWHLQLRELEDSSWEERVDVKWGNRNVSEPMGLSWSPSGHTGPCAHSCFL